ncbi:MAG: PAS domain-containing protein, partial [Paracoccaceae bacterium]
MDGERGFEAGVVAALGDASFGLLLFDPQMALVQATPPVAALLPGLAGLLVPGTPCGALFDVQDGDPGRVTVTRHASKHHHGISLQANRTADGGLLVLVRDDTDARSNVQSLTNVIEGGTVGTWEWEVDTGRLTVNDRWITMLGYRRSDLEPLTFEIWRALLHPEDRVALADKFGRLLPDLQADFDNQFRLRHANGGWVWIEGRGRVLRWSHEGIPAFVAGVHMDISAQKVAEHRLEHILEGAQVGTWQYDEITGENHID